MVILPGLLLSLHLPLNNISNCRSVRFRDRNSPSRGTRLRPKRASSMSFFAFQTPLARSQRCLRDRCCCIISDSSGIVPDSSCRCLRQYAVGDGTASAVSETPLLRRPLIFEGICLTCLSRVRDTSDSCSLFENRSI